MDKSTNHKNSFLQDLLFPKFCLGCQTEGTFLCEDCRELLEIIDHGYCLCERSTFWIPKNSKEGKCPKCRHKKLSGLYFALSYKEKTLTRKLIHQFKYKPFIKNLAKPLASLLIEHFIKTGKNTNDPWENGVLVPVPLDQKKIKDRGYNQSEELSKELSKVLKIPVASNILIKIKSTPPQMEQKREERLKNLAGAFTINKNCATSEIAQFSKIFLVDDVYTTGSTMEHCSQVLLDAGAKSVWGIALAREG